jgi:hypothetical protein
LRLAALRSPIWPVYCSESHCILSIGQAVGADTKECFDMEVTKSVRTAGRPRVIRGARHLAVASVSLAIVASATGYVLSPAVDAMAAQVSAVTAVAGKEAIKGRVTSGKGGAAGTIVRVVKRVNGKDRVVARAKVDAKGEFSIPARPGKYTVVLQRGSTSQKRVAVSVTKGHSVFVGAEVTKTAGGWSIAPVIFNY